MLKKHPLFLTILLLWSVWSVGQKEVSPLNGLRLQHKSTKTTLRTSQNLAASIAPQTGIPGDSKTNSTNPPSPNALLTPYNFAQTSGTYTAITGGTVLGNTSNDENVFGTYSIGFTFTFNGTAFTQFSVATNGFIGLGSTTVTTSGTPLTGTSNNVIAALGVDLQGQTGSEIQYKLSGSSPNRTLVVQWTNYRKKSATGDVFNFQIRLNESGNSIQLYFIPENLDIPN